KEVEATKNFIALVVANGADNFSAGANLMLVLLEAQEGNWDEVDAMVRAFQSATMALKTCVGPVVVAPAGLTLGGGCEISLHASHVRAAAETYIGLVEAGVGLIPAGVRRHHDESRSSARGRETRCTRPGRSRIPPDDSAHGRPCGRPGCLCDARSGHPPRPSGGPHHRS